MQRVDIFRDRLEWWIKSELEDACTEDEIKEYVNTFCNEPEDFEELKEQWYEEGWVEVFDGLLEDFLMEDLPN